MRRKSISSVPLRLRINPVVEVGETLAQRVKTELPTHEGLATAAEAVAAAARQAQRVSQSMNRILSIHRLPAFFLAAALLCLMAWIYWRFFHVATLTLALPDRDASLIRDQIAGSERVSFREVLVSGSREAIERVSRGQVDLAFVQGGLDIPPQLPRLETPSPELVLFFVRDHVDSIRDVKRILTSSTGEGSHSVLLHFLVDWQIAQNVQLAFDWRRLTGDRSYEIPADIDAAFVVKDPADEKTLEGVKRLIDAGFQLAPPDIGARVTRHDFLRATEIPTGFLSSEHLVPEAPTRTYAVATFLVARRGLTPRLLAQAARVLHPRPPSIADMEFHPTAADAGEMFQGVEAFMGIILNIALAFLALLGLDMLAYRKQFHELNSLVSLLSMLQSNKDVLGLADADKRAENLLYLSLVSDLLGVISMIVSYYTQENSSLLFNHLSEVIHQRCDGLKINIQLKILHASVELTPRHENQPLNAANQAAAIR